MKLVQRLLSENGTQQGLDIYEVAEGLRKLGHAVTLRSALGGGGGNECLRNLRHSFLTCRMQGTLPACSISFHCPFLLQLLFVTEHLLNSRTPFAFSL